MAGTCCDTNANSADIAQDGRWRRALWIALAVNAGMFFVEIAAGVAADSLSLAADALDFLGDAANYAISLVVAGMAFTIRARAALLKGVTLLAFGSWIFGSTAWALWHGRLPDSQTMGLVGMLALVANVGVALLLYRYRTGDANMRSVWICSRNDAIGNVTVMLAAAGVLGTGSAWPDLMVAAILAGLAISGGVQIVRHALRELASATPENAPGNKCNEGVLS